MAIVERLEDIQRERPKSPRRDRTSGGGDRKNRASLPRVIGDERSNEERSYYRCNKGNEHWKPSKPNRGEVARGEEKPTEKGEGARKGCFLCDGNHMARFCTYKKRLNAMIKDRENEKIDATDNKGGQHISAIRMLGAMVEHKEKESKNGLGKKAKNQGIQYANIAIEGKFVQAMVDTCANHNFIKKPKVARQLGLVPTKDEGWVKAVNSEERQVQGVVKGVELRIGGWKRKVDFTVIEMDDHEVILGMKFMDKCNATPIPYLGVMLMLGGDGKTFCMVPLVSKGEGTSKVKALGTIELVKVAKLKPGEKTIGLRTYAEVVKRLREQQARHERLS